MRADLFRNGKNLPRSPLRKAKDFCLSEHLIWPEMFLRSCTRKSSCRRSSQKETPVITSSWTSTKWADLEFYSYLGIGDELVKGALKCWKKNNFLVSRNNNSNLFFSFFSWIFFNGGRCSWIPPEARYSNRRRLPLGRSPIVLISRGLSRATVASAMPQDSQVNASPVLSI